MQRRNDGSNKKKDVLGNKIGAILSGARSTATTARSRIIKMAFGLGDEEEELDQVHPTNCLQLACTRRITASSSLSRILASSGLRRWKTSLKKVARVKLRLKAPGNDGKPEAKTELELCKKRILMGEKCRAMNRSGVLHYDKHGILLPED